MSMYLKLRNCLQLEARKILDVRGTLFQRKMLIVSLESEGNSNSPRFRRKFRFETECILTVNPEWNRQFGFVRVVVNKRQLACSENYKWAGVNKRREARKWLLLGRNAPLFPRAERQIVSCLSLALSLFLLYIYVYMCFLFLAHSVSPLHPVCDWALVGEKASRRGRIDLSRSIDYSTRLVLRAESWISLSLSLSLFFCFPFTVFSFLFSPFPPTSFASHLLPGSSLPCSLPFHLSGSTRRKSCLKAFEISLLETLLNRITRDGRERERERGRVG